MSGIKLYSDFHFNVPSKYKFFVFLIFLKYWMINKGTKEVINNKSFNLNWTNRHLPSEMFFWREKHLIDVLFNIPCFFMKKCDHCMIAGLRKDNVNTTMLIKTGCWSQGLFGPVWVQECRFSAPWVRFSFYEQAMNLLSKRSLCAVVHLNQKRVRKHACFNHVLLNQTISKPIDESCYHQTFIGN